jgi:hypothetical protein
MLAKPTISARSRRRQRRGALYIVVLGVALTVSLIGMSGLMVSQLQLRRASQAQDWTEAGDLALSAIEQAIKLINSSSNWRSSYTNNTESYKYPMGNGTFSYKLVDAALGTPGGDGNLNNNTYDPVRLHGIGRVGKTVRVYSVQLIGDTPMDVLRTDVATSGYLNVAVQTGSVAGPLSSNGLFTRGATVNGNVEAGSVSGAGAINGTLTTPATAKAMPDVTVFDAYKRMATTIAWTAGGTWNMSAPLLSNSIDPFSAPTNVNGIYYISVPSNSTLNIQVSHIKGTLVIDCADKAKVQINSTIYWEPNSTDLPILLIRHTGTSSVKDVIQPASGTITEGSTTYSAQLKGLIHVIGGTAAAVSGNAELQLGGTAPIQGTVIVNQDAKVTSNATTFNHDYNLYLNPPVGYSTGATVKIVAGSCLWEAAP